METRKVFKISMKENFIKNVLVIIILFLFYPCLNSSLKAVDTSKMSDFLLILSILLVIVSFANFSFTYEIAIVRVFGLRILSHLATFLFMLLIGFLLEAMVIAVGFVYPSLYALILIFSCLLYFSLAVHDFWDFLRAFRRYK